MDPQSCIAVSFPAEEQLPSLDLTGSPFGLSLPGRYEYGSNKKKVRRGGEADERITCMLISKSP